MSNRLIDEAFNRLPLPAAVITRTGRVTEQTRAMAEFFHPANAQGDASALEATLQAPQLLRDIQAIAVGQKVTLHRRCGDRLERYPFAVYPLAHGEMPPQHYLLALDPHSRLDKGFARLNQQLREAKEAASVERQQRRALRRDVRHMQQFSALAAHDIKAPVRHISLLLSMFSEDYGAGLSPEARTQIAHVQGAADRLGGLVSDLLAYARLETLDETLVRIELDQLVADLGEESRTALDEAEGTLVTPASLPVVDGALPLVRQLFSNLIGNAIKYRSSARPLVVEIAPLDAAGVRITDNGIGFDPKYATQLFQPFQRLTTEREGSGLGLAGCRVICERHGWRIEGVGKPDQGAEFRVIFSPTSEPDSAG